MDNPDLNAGKNESVIMGVLSAQIHPSYDNTTAYYDVAVLTVNSVPTDRVIRFLPPFSLKSPYLRPHWKDFSRKWDYM